MTRADESIRRSLQLLIVGILLRPFLLNLIAAASSFWAANVLHDTTRSRALWTAAARYAPLVSFVFAAALLTLTRVESRRWIKALSWVCASLYCLSSFHRLARDPFMSGSLAAFNGLMGCLMILVGAMVLLQFLRARQTGGVATPS
jgi:hypothetical protein